MTELELYNFIKENKITWHRVKNKGKEDLLMLVGLDDIKKALEMFNLHFDDNMECFLGYSYVNIWMQAICERNGIEMKNVFID